MQSLILSVICVSLFFGLFSSVQANNFSFPAGSPWYTDISSAAVDSNSANVISFLSSAGIWTTTNKFQIDFSFNIQYASASTPRYSYVQDEGYYLPDCDTLSTFPVPPGGTVEGESGYNEACNGDCHFLVVDTVNNKLYESYQTVVDTESETISGLCAIEWDLCQLYPDNLRGDQCTSTDAAGFPIAPLLVTADELASGTVNHALRFILPNNVMRQGYYVHPASHAGGPSSTNANAIIYGTRLRLKSSFDPSTLSEGGTPAATAVVNALKKYGMFLADGGNLPLTFANDTYTTHKYADLDFDSHSLFGINPTDFDVIAHETPTALTYNCVRNTFSGNACGTPAPTTKSATSPPTPKPTAVPTAKPATATPTAKPPTSAPSQTVCVTNIGENTATTIACPLASQKITTVQFASYGTPTGSCGSFATGSCNAATSVSYTQGQCLNLNSCTFTVGNSAFNDPCVGTVKHYDAQVLCQ